MRSTTHIGRRTAIAVFVAIVALLAFYARGLEPGITFATGGIDLKIDSKGWYNGLKVPGATWKLKNLVPGSDKFFNFDDIKPGDYGCEVISLHVKKTDAWLCVDFKNLEEGENGVNEPESDADDADDTDAELADGTQFFGWTDDGDGRYEPGQGENPLFGGAPLPASVALDDKTYAIGDSRRGGVCRVNQTRWVGMCWCAGTLTVQTGMGPLSGPSVCDPTSLGNEAQTDSFSVDVELRAEPAKLKPQFVCGGVPPVPPPPPPHCQNCGPVNITVSNNANVTSTTTSSANTGGNSAEGGNATSDSTGSPQAGLGLLQGGGATSTATSTNIINFSRVRL